MMKTAERAERTTENRTTGTTAKVNIISGLFDGNSHVNKDITVRSAICNAVLSNCQGVGGSKFAMIPLNVLFANKMFQRNGIENKAKIKKLYEKWDFLLCDPIKVVYYPEVSAFSIVNGWHRLQAMLLHGIASAKCEIIDLTEQDIEKRIKMEAKLFAEQGDCVEVLTPMQRHNANLLNGVRENVLLEKLSKKYDLKLHRNRGAVRVNHENNITSFNTCLKVLKKKNGENILDYALHTLCEARWNLSVNGLGRPVMVALTNVLKLHQDRIEDVAYEAAKYFVNIEPNKFFAEAKVNYPEITDNNANTRHLEDIVCAALNIPTVYAK